MAFLIRELIACLSVHDDAGAGVLELLHEEGGLAQLEVGACAELRHLFHSVLLIPWLYIGIVRNPFRKGGEGPFAGKLKILRLMTFLHYCDDIFLQERFNIRYIAVLST